MWFQSETLRRQHNNRGFREEAIAVREWQMMIQRTREIHVDGNENCGDLEFLRKV